MLKLLRNSVMIGFALVVVILIILVNAKEIAENKGRVFETEIDGMVVRIGEESYTYEHHLRVQDPNDFEVYFLAKDTKPDEELRFTVIDKENVPAGHLLERYANWEDAQKIHNRAADLKSLARTERDAQEQ